MNSLGKDEPGGSCSFGVSDPVMHHNFRSGIALWVDASDNSVDRCLGYCEGNCSRCCRKNRNDEKPQKRRLKVSGKKR